MLDISIPWSVILWMAPILMPFLSIPGALLAGLGWYRRKKNFYTALVAAVLGAFVVPWAVLLAVGAMEWLGKRSQNATPLVIGASWLIGALAIVGLAIWGASHAGSRRRRGD